MPPGSREPRDDPRAWSVAVGRAAGRVLDDAGRPVRGARVTIRSEKDRPPPRVGAEIRTRVWTDAAGRFSVDCVHDEPHLITVVGPPHLFLRTPVGARPGDEEVTIRLAPAAQPIVTVLEAGKPLANVSVYLSVPGRPRIGSVTDPRGRVRFGGLDPEGTYHLKLYPPRGRSDLPRRTIPEFRPEDTSITLERIRTLRGLVRDRDGLPVGAASLWFRQTGKDGKSWRAVEVRDDGRFLAEWFPYMAVEYRAGTARLELEAPDLVTGTVPAGVDKFDIAIDGGTWIGLTVPDWPWRSPGRVSLAWQGGVRRLPLGASGRVRFHGLPEGKDFSLHVGPLPDGRMAFGDDLLPGADHEVPLRAGHEISGRILGPEGATPYHMSVYGKGIALRYDFVGERPPTDWYRVGGLPKGRYLFTILASDGDGYYKGEVRVRTGEPTDLKLEVSED